ncbi:hypothetical protein ACH5RR_040323 [Cinchona calisaya]|uniref:Uncharacterized protein n=1 Tax=Cinchona calisaya TaxID=153742 RepID=A0ABD2XTC5_9GENT
MKDKGLETDQLFVYIRTGTDPNSVPKDDEASIVIGQMREKLSQIPATEQTSKVKQRIFKEVMGSEYRGYVRTVGSDPSPAQYFGETSSKNQLSNNYMTMILNKVEELYEQKYGGKISDMQSQIDALNARLQSGGSTVVGTPPLAYTQGAFLLPPYSITILSDLPSMDGAERRAISAFEQRFMDPITFGGATFVHFKYCTTDSQMLMVDLLSIDDDGDSTTQPHRSTPRLAEIMRNQMMDPLLESRQRYGSSWIV